MSTNRDGQHLPIGQKYDIRRERVHYGGPNGLSYEGRTISYLSGKERIYVFVPAGEALLLDLNGRTRGKPRYRRYRNTPGRGRTLALEARACRRPPNTRGGSARMLGPADRRMDYTTLLTERGQRSGDPSSG